ncbi:hypothetical protein GW915_07635 [bacterium]|nr:hypothetical protein [bacterium]
MDTVFKTKLEDEIQRIESLSSVEVVPAYLESSSDYNLQKGNLALLAVVFSLVLYASLAELVEIWQMCLLGFLTFVCTLLVLSRKKILIFFVPKEQQKLQVERRARRLFLDNEVFATRDRTGLLILVSQLEKAVYILADKGLVEKMPASFWQELSLKLASDFDKHLPGLSFIQALSEAEKDLALHFPIKADDQNELDDHLRN